MDPVSVMSWIGLGNMVLPKIMNVLLHYKELENSSALSETDKTLMKKNLEDLKLPDWETL